MTKVGFSSESALLTYYNSNTDTLRLAVVFYGVSNGSSLPTAMAYRIRPATNDSQKWYTTDTYPFYQANSPRKSSDGPGTLYTTPGRGQSTNDALDGMVT